MITPPPPHVSSMSPAALARLLDHKTVLDAQNVKDLRALGALTISGVVVPQPGFVRAAFIPRPIRVEMIPFPGKGKIPQKPIEPTGDASARTDAPAQRQAAPAPPDGRSKADAQLLGGHPSNATYSNTTVRGARRISPQTARGAAPQITTVSGPARKLSGERFAPSLLSSPTARTGQSTNSVIPIDTAYWVAGTEIVLNNTTVVIQQNVRHLVIIAPKITVVGNVAIAYDEIPQATPPSVPGKPSNVPGKPATPATGAGWGGTGGVGDAGTSPPQALTPPDAPEVELWTLDINQIPTVNLQGQIGYKGTTGGVGGDGGPGGDGAPAVNAKVAGCKSGPGPGGNGGQGGRGGDGGQGGNGGLGGAWSLYTVAPVLQNLSYTILLTGGERGPGGDPGAGGTGGPGGSRGTLTSRCDDHGRSDGSAGASGAPGVKGLDGASGAARPNSLSHITIDQVDFDQKLSDPAIDHVNPQYPATVTVGATITIYGVSGHKFLSDDIVRVSGSVASATYISDTMLQAVVPSVNGGQATVQVSRNDGSGDSNLASLWIKPVVNSTVPASPAQRLMPGSTVTINGTGFHPQTSVRVNNEDIGAATFVNSQQITFTMKRPASIPHNSPGGEPANLSVAVGSGTFVSNALPIIIGTYQMLVIGDSVAWGEGLQDQHKFHSLVEAEVKALHSGTSVYKTVKAHTGAIVGWNNVATGPELDGDIPVSHPTVKQQAQTLVGSTNAATIDLILLTGCANDVGFSTFLDPLASLATIQSAITQKCDVEYSQFLIDLAGKFPSARIIVTSYYQGVSQYTDSLALVDVVGVMYGIMNHQGVGLAAIQLQLGLSGANIPLVIQHAAFFETQSTIAINNAVAMANTTIGSARIKFADAQFGPTHAARAVPGPAWVFGLVGVLKPMDDQTSLDRREAVCEAQYGKGNEDYRFCRLASTGHPNTLGAIAYFNAIKPHL